MMDSKIVKKQSQLVYWRWLLGTFVWVAFWFGSIAFAIDTDDSVPTKAELAKKPSTEKVTYEKHIRPLFTTRCASCHNPNNQSGDLDVTNYSALMEGGGSGESITPGDAEASYLFQLVIHEDSPEMPPDSEKIPNTEIELLKKWINGGALENSKSTFQPVKTKVSIAAVNPGVRPKIVPKPCRLTKQSELELQRPPVVVASDSSPWSPIFAAGGARSVLFYRTSDLSFMGLIPFPEGQIKALRFAAGGQVLVAAGGRSSANGVVRVIDVTTAKTIAEHQGELDSVLSADIDPSLEAISFGGPDRKVKSLGTDPMKEKFQLSKHTDWVQNVRYSPDGVLLATGDRNGGLRVWESDTGRDYLDLRGHKGGITGLDWSPDSNILYSGSQDGSVKLWEMENGSNLKSWKAHNAGLTDLKVNRIGQVLTSGRDQQAVLWDGQGKAVKRFQLPVLPTSVSFCDETGRVFVCCFDGKTRVFDSKTGSKIGEIVLAPVSLKKQLAMELTNLSRLQTKSKPLMIASESLIKKIKSQSDVVSDLNRKKDQIKKQLAELEQNKIRLVNSLKEIDQKLQNDVSLLANQKQKSTQNKQKLTPILKQLEEQKKKVAGLQNEMDFDRQLKLNQKLTKEAISKLEVFSDQKNQLNNLLATAKKQLSSTEEQIRTESLLLEKAIEMSKDFDKKGSQQLSVSKNLPTTIQNQSNLLLKLTEDIGQLKVSQKALTESVERSQKNPQLLSALNDLNTVLAGKESQSKSLIQKLNSDKSELINVRKFLAESESKRKRLQEDATKKTKQLASLKSIRIRNQKEVAGLQGKWNSVEKEFTLWKEKYEQFLQKEKELRKN